jgi:hypothetical protein
MIKLPWIKWYPDDWLSATTTLSPSTCGVWMNMLMYMHLNGRTGEVMGTMEVLARIGRCNLAEMELAIDELKRYKVADVTKSNAKSHVGNALVTLINRRMKKEYMKLNSNRLRKQKHDQKKRGNAQSTLTVTPKKTEDRRQKTDKEKNRVKKEHRDFVPPALPDLVLFMVSIGTGEEDASDMFNHYQSNGWMVGKNKMNDWQSAAKSWISRKKQFQKPSSKKDGKSNNEKLRDWVAAHAGTN